MSEKVTLENGSVTKLFFKFALPSIFGMLIISIQVMIDGMFLSASVGPLGLAAVNLSMPLVNLLLSIGLMICIGGGVVAGIYNGNKRISRSREITTIGLVLLFVILQGLSTIILLNLDFFIKILGATSEIYPYVKAYLIPMMIGAFLYSSPIYTETFTKLIDKPNLVFLSGVSSLATNVIFDYILIMKLGMGMRGAGTATVLAGAVSFLALLPFLKFKTPKKDIRVYKEDIKNIFYNGSSEMFTTISSTVAMYLFNIVIVKNIGILGVSALTIVFYINLVLNISLYGLSQALQPIVAYNVGARRMDKINEVLKVSFITGGSLGLIVYILSHIGGEKVISVFSKGNIELLNLTKEALFIISFSYLISFINIISTSFLTSIEKPMESVVVSLSRSIIFIVLPLFILPNLIGRQGIWLAIPIAELCTVGVSYYLMKISRRNLNKRIIKL